MTESKSALFPALLKYWRNARGLSQLDLSLAADVSSRHISFMETGRASPSREMVLLLGNTLQIPFREQNELLKAAEFEPEFDEPGLSLKPDDPITQVIQRMMKKHDPYPMIVMDWAYNLLIANTSATKMLTSFVHKPEALRPPINVFEMIFDPNLARPFIENWEHIARHLLVRVHRECLLKPHDKRLTGLLEKVLAYPGVPQDWRQPDFSLANDPVISVKLKRGELALHFLTTITSFNAPQNITMEELLIESYYPLDEKTEKACSEMGGS